MLKTGELQILQLRLSSGIVLPQVTVAYELEGPSGHENTVVALGGISAKKNVTTWWKNLFGPGKIIDPLAHRILSFDFLGGHGETKITGHTDSHPVVSTQDQAQILLQLLDHLQISKVSHFIGASYGGMVGQAFAEKNPQRINQLVVISAAHCSSPHSVAFRVLQRKIISSFLEIGQAEKGISLARSLAMITYRTPEEFNQRFNNTPTDPEDVDSFPAWNYLKARGDHYAQTMSAKAYLCLSHSIDQHQVDVRKITAPTLVVAVKQDQLVPWSLCETMTQQLAGPKQFVCIESIYGHDAFLKEEVLFTQILNDHLIKPNVPKGTVTPAGL
ncbi:MAG: homoserine O-succinyltransferase MetX [Pseudobdellovibrionaceae bacterium]